MRPRYVVDTNVLIAASAVFPLSPTAQTATPADPELRRQVHDWLNEYQASDSRMVLDGEGKIDQEYRDNVGFNDFGRQVIIHKWSTCAVDVVDVLYDDDGNGYLDEPLCSTIHDVEDRKMVAAALAALVLEGGCWIANSGDTDWYDWVDALKAHGVDVEQIIEVWSRAKWLAKKGDGC